MTTTTTSTATVSTSPAASSAGSQALTSDSLNADHLAPTSLSELNSAAGLLTRVDRKYLVPLERAQELVGGLISGVGGGISAGQVVWREGLSRGGALVEGAHRCGRRHRLHDHWFSDGRINVAETGRLIGRDRTRALAGSLGGGPGKGLGGALRLLGRVFRAVVVTLEVEGRGAAGLLGLGGRGSGAVVLLGLLLSRVGAGRLNRIDGLDGLSGVGSGSGDRLPLAVQGLAHG